MTRLSSKAFQGRRMRAPERSPAISQAPPPVAGDRRYFQEESNRMFRRKYAEPRITVAPTDLSPDSPPDPLAIFDRSQETVVKAIDYFRKEEASLVASIADLNERLGKARLHIKAFEAAEALLSGADEPRHIASANANGVVQTDGAA